MYKFIYLFLITSLSRAEKQNKKELYIGNACREKGEQKNTDISHSEWHRGQYYARVVSQSVVVDSYRRESVGDREAGCDKLRYPDRQLTKI